MFSLWHAYNPGEQVWQQLRNRDLANRWPIVAMIFTSTSSIPAARPGLNSLEFMVLSVHYANALGDICLLAMECHGSRLV